MGLSPAAALHAWVSSAWEKVTAFSDGSDYLLGAIAKLRNVAGTVVNPSTEDKQDSAITKLTSIDGKDFATQTTLSSLLTKLTELDTAIDAIKDTDGVKKITDPLPAGTNNIGDVDVLSSALPTGASTSALQSTLIGHVDGLEALLTTIDSILDSIKDTDGIKKITDALPTGDNVIGRAKVTDGTSVLDITTGGQAKAVEYDDVNNVPLAVAPNVDIPTNTRAKLVAGKSDLGIAKILRMGTQGELITSGSEVNVTGFGETRVASPYLVGNYVNKYGLDDYWYDTDEVGAGDVSFVALQSAIRMSVTGASGDKARLRTNNYFRYQAGRSMLVRITGYCGDSGQTNQTRRWGLFDDEDGLFFEMTDTTMYVVQRSSVSGSVVDTKVAQSSWNKDTMDGDGPSGVTLDPTKGNIWEVTFQWLGVGVVSFFINGELIHQFENPNSFANPYMKTAVLPVSWEVENTGASTAGSYTYICGSVSVEGGAELPEYTFCAYNDSDVVIDETESPILSIRPSSTFNSIANRMAMIPIFGTVSTDGARASYRVVLNGTLTGAAWVSANALSVGQYDVSATALTGGVTLVRGLLPNTIDSRELDLRPIFNAFSRALRMKAFSTDVDVLTIMCRNEKNTGGETNMRASITWQEVR